MHFSSQKPRELWDFFGLVMRHLPQNMPKEKARIKSYLKLIFEDYIEKNTICNAENYQM